MAASSFHAFHRRVNNNILAGPLEESHVLGWLFSIIGLNLRRIGEPRWIYEYIRDGEHADWADIAQHRHL